MKNKIVCLCYLLCHTFIVFSQKTNLKGKILNQIDSSPISYVQISLKKSDIGTITNQNGEFELKIDSSAINDSLVIQHISFASKIICVKEFLKNQDSIINLELNTYLLDEVNIVSTDSLRIIVYKALKKIRRNYPNKIHYMSAYFRETTFDHSNKAKSLTEAAFDIQDKGILSSKSNLKIRINEMRRSNNSNTYSLFSKLLDKYFGKSNEIYNTLEKNMIRFYFDKNNINKTTGSLKRIKQKHIIYTLEKQIQKKDRIIWCIHYENPKTINALFKECGTLYINLNDYAIEKIKHSTVIDPELKNKPDFPELNLEIAYRKVDNKYYLSHIIEKGVHQSKSMTLEEKLILINQLYLRKTDFNRIRNKFAEKHTESLHDKEYRYNESFWKNYNIIKKEPISKKIVNDLEKNKKLKRQFLENSTE
jgi:hypothetical protein